MRIPFPERIPLNRVAIFAVVLFMIQSMEHTLSTSAPVVPRLS